MLIPPCGYFAYRDMAEIRLVWFSNLSPIVQNDIEVDGRSQRTTGDNAVEIALSQDSQLRNIRWIIHVAEQIVEIAFDFLCQRVLPCICQKDDYPCIGREEGSRNLRRPVPDSVVEPFKPNIDDIVDALDELLGVASFDASPTVVLPLCLNQVEHLLKIIIVDCINTVVLPPPSVTQPAALSGLTSAAVITANAANERVKKADSRSDGGRL